jgi:hypothetical protein
VTDVCVALTVLGIALVDLTPQAFMYYAVASRALPVPEDSRYTGHVAWELLHQAGRFSAQVPRTLRAAMLPGQLPTAARC